MKHIGWSLLAIFLLLASCSGGRRHGLQNARKGQLMSLSSLDDSVKKQSPLARKLIGQGMASAEDSLTYYEYYVRMGQYFCLSSTPDSMVEYIDRTIAFASRQPKSPRLCALLAYAYNCQAANYHNFHKNPDGQVKLYRMACEYSLQSDTKDQTPKICANLGDAYLSKNQLPEAAACYRRALFLVDSLQLPRKENITLYMGLATIYQQLNDFSTSLKYFQQTERYFDEMPLNMQAYYLNNYGNYYYYKKDYPNSLKKFLRMKQLLERHHKTDTFDMYLCKLNMADVYLNLDSIALSEKYLSEAEPFMTANHDLVAVYYCNTIHIGQEVKKGNMAAVSLILNREKAEFPERKDSDIAFNLRQIRNHYLREYYKAKGDFRSAYLNLKADQAMIDSLEHNRVNMRASEVMERFTQDTLRLHHSLEMEHKTAEVRKANLIALAAVAIVLLVGLAFVLKWLQSRKRLEEDKLRIMQLKLASARNRISPHFVFNVLNNKIVNAGQQEANELLALTKLIRANLDMSCRLEVSLKEELEFVNQYVEVEKYLLGDDFCYRVEVAQDILLDQIFLPSMFVQILVENAFVHGLKGWEGSKLLQVKVERLLDGSIQIAVLDNGPGFDIRSVGKKRIGLNIITQTIAIFNEHNRGKGKMTFSLRNLTDAEGKVTGCESRLSINKKTI